MASSPKNTPHMITLRVMRLARPKFFEGASMGIDPADEFSGLVDQVVCKSTGKDGMEFPVSGFLMAPRSIDNIYLGETFTFYVAVLNESGQKCQGVKLQTDIQTQTQKVALDSKLNVGQNLDPKTFLGHTVSHEIKEVGQHILVCTVTYYVDEIEYSFRKFFKFPVQKPIDVRTKFFNTEDHLNNDVYLEAQIQNLCSNPMIMEKVALDPSELYGRKELVSSERDSPIHLDSGEVHQYLFCLSPNTSDHCFSDFRGVTTIGKLDMSWRTTMGEPGRLQTSPLTRVSPSYGDIRLLIESIPGTVQKHNLFSVKCKVLNCCERSLDLVLTLDNSEDRPFLLASLSGIHLGQIQPNAFVQFEVEVLPLNEGLQSLSGIRITDSFLKRTYELDDIAKVMVTEEN
ncbi:unnamed protein product [Bursaphelenchus okinawaensis]|uniref:Trafficking protein particle complex subunit 13 n=1 Tax=Bursaphelenchus okinawaensis TaxID=465554 RepID=A0A811KRD5_9BILA|nr:unnamed protein product [Bursaphelenchus okinawaensis]CAG9112317.1 unnamed protein product [Bursaphelenchus okinawaensis]